MVDDTKYLLPHVFQESHMKILKRNMQLIEYSLNNHLPSLTLIHKLKCM